MQRVTVRLHGYFILLNIRLLGVEASPLKLFSRAKQAINSIYSEFDSFIAEVDAFVDCKKKTTPKNKCSYF